MPVDACRMCIAITYFGYFLDPQIVPAITSQIIEYLMTLNAIAVPTNYITVICIAPGTLRLLKQNWI